MTINYMVFDFETVDKYIDRKLGAGWVYGIRVPDSDFEVLGCAIGMNGITTKYYPEMDVKDLNKTLPMFDYVIAHNAQYDIGCAHYMKWKIRDKPVYDTEVMARVYDSSLMSYSLDALAQKYLGIPKDDKVLLDAIKEHDLYPWFKYEHEAKRKATKKGITYIRDYARHKETVLLKWAKMNMKVIQKVAPDAMAQYACADVDITWKLFNYFKERLSASQLALALDYSMLAHICIDYRVRGIRIDLDAIKKAQREIGPLAESMKERVYEEAGMIFNIASSHETGLMLVERGLDVPFQDEAPERHSVTAKWLNRQDDKICAMLTEYKQYGKIKKDVFDKLLEIQKYTVGPDAYKLPYGRIYPELNILRARTGRFSSTGPNIQNIPVRHEVLGPMCRAFFVPEEGETWYSLDYSNQEGRLQLHYAYNLDCRGAEELLKEFLRDPRFDLHQRVADLCGISRFDGKTINLGISYGMALNSLGQALGVNRSGAQALKKQYNKEMPYLSQLSKKCEDTMVQTGRVKTLGGRLLRREVGYEYKSLNKLIQGSALDQTARAMIMAYRRGLPVLFPVHDELNMSSRNVQDAYDLQALMITAYELDVPTVVDIGKGANWNEAH